MRSRLVIFFICVFVGLGTLLLDSCKKTPLFMGTRLPFVLPPGFPPTVYNFNDKPITEESFLLGRKLFYDGRLSIDGHFPCSSCHQQVAAFTTFEHDRSHGYNNSHTVRNAPALSNLAWYPAFNQDGGMTSLEQLSEAHITNPIEMGETMTNVINKIKTDTAYQRMFNAAYGSPEVNSNRMLDALSQFVVNLVSANSRYDKVKRGEAFFTAAEQRGYTLFQAKCATCHTEPLFTDFSYRNTGLPIEPGLNDYGRMRVTGRKEDSLKFRVPSLRNVELSSYYAHDGRFSFMRMMLDHYRSGVVQSTTLDPLLKPNGIQMTNTEQDDLVAFLRTLSDSSYLVNPRYRE